MSAFAWVELRRVADLLEAEYGDYLEPGQHVSVGVGSRPCDVQVHGTSPETLAAVARHYAATSGYSQLVDADGLCRYVAVDTPELEVMWQRR